MIILRDKLFATKHDENWYKGEETDKQKKGRKKLAGTLAAEGAILGGSIAGANNDSHIKAWGKEHRARLDDTMKELDVNVAKLKTVGRVKPEDRATYNKLMEAVDERLEHNKAATEKFAKKAGKIANKKLAKSVGKGAAIGLGIGGGLAYLANKGIKSANEKGNAARRNKNKK